jgi:hypothetical protein
MSKKKVVEEEKKIELNISICTLKKPNILVSSNSSSFDYQLLSSRAIASCTN